MFPLPLKTWHTWLSRCMSWSCRAVINSNRSTVMTSDMVTMNRCSSGFWGLTCATSTRRPRKAKFGQTGACVLPSYSRGTTLCLARSWPHSRRLNLSTSRRVSALFSLQSSNLRLIRSLKCWCRLTKTAPSHPKMTQLANSRRNSPTSNVFWALVGSTNERIRSLLLLPALRPRCSPCKHSLTSCVWH